MSLFTSRLNFLIIPLCPVSVCTFVYSSRALLLIRVGIVFFLSSPNPLGHFIKLPLETDKDVVKRHNSFVSCWSKLKEKTEVRVVAIYNSNMLCLYIEVWCNS